MSQHTTRQRHLDACRSQAIEMMNSPRGQEAREGGYYTELFGWVYNKLRDGVIPTGIPVKKLEAWKAIGEYRKGRISR